MDNICVDDPEEFVYEGVGVIFLRKKWRKVSLICQYFLSENVHK